jgi:RNA polymerase sigma-70 factor (ECF subfamily)
MARLSLFERSETGAEDPVAELAAEFGPSLSRYFARRVSDQAEVEDLVQDVFVRLLRRPEVRAMEGARGYVFETASSVLIDWARRRQTRRWSRHESFDVEQHGGVDFAPDHVLQSKERLAQAMAVLLDLPERTRTIFLLRRVEAMPYKDIAGRFGISVSAVEKHMRRAILHLSRHMGD